MRAEDLEVMLEIRLKGIQGPELIILVQMPVQWVDIFHERSHRMLRRMTFLARVLIEYSTML
jgi:hypothetical protein